MFIAVISMGMIVNISYLLSLDNTRFVTLKSTIAYFLAWIYDNTWFESMNSALKIIQSRPAAIVGIVTVYFYVLQFSMRNVLHRMFVSVVIEGTFDLISVQKVPCNH